VDSKQRSMVYSGRGRPPKAMKGLGMMILPREGGAGGGDSSGDEDDGTQAAAAEVEAERLKDEDRDYSEEETDEEVSRGDTLVDFPLLIGWVPCAYPMKYTSPRNVAGCP